jgi:hypothetical protein
MMRRVSESFQPTATTTGAAAAHTGQLAAQLWWHLGFATLISRNSGRVKERHQNLCGEAAYFRQDCRARERVALAAKIGRPLDVLVVAAQLGAKSARASLDELAHTFERFEDTVSGVALEATVEIVHQQVGISLALVTELDQNLVDIPLTKQVQLLPFFENKLTRVVDPDPDWIRIQRLCGSGSVFGIRIPDPDPGARKLRNFSGKMHFLVIF